MCHIVRLTLSSTTLDGYRQQLRSLRSWGDVVVVGVEGTGSWGAGLTRHLTAAGVDVLEVMRPNPQHRRRYGTSDEADAIGAARAVLSGEAVGTPKAGTGQVEAIRLLRIARRSAMKARTQAGNQIHAVIDTPRTATAPLRRPDDRRHRHRGRTIPRRHAPTTPLEAARLSLRTLARRWEHLDDELAALDAELDELTASTAPTLLATTASAPRSPLRCSPPPVTIPTGCAHQRRSRPLRRVTNRPLLRPSTSGSAVAALSLGRSNHRSPCRATFDPRRR